MPKLAVTIGLRLFCVGFWQEKPGQSKASEERSHHSPDGNCKSTRRVLSDLFGLLLDARQEHQDKDPEVGDVFQDLAGYESFQEWDALAKPHGKTDKGYAGNYLAHGGGLAEALGGFAQSPGRNEQHEQFDKDFQ